MSTLPEAEYVRVYYRFEEIEEEKVPETSVELMPISTKVESVFALQQEPVDKSTPRPTKWDWMFGVIMPLVCFFFDPFVFRDWSNDGPGLLGAYQVPVYAIACTSVMTMAAWLLWGDKLGQLRIPAAFVMLVGALTSSIIAAVLFPFSVVGLLFVIGILGFTPGFTAAIYWRSAFRVLRSLGNTRE